MCASFDIILVILIVIFPEILPIYLFEYVNNNNFIEMFGHFVHLSISGKLEWIVYRTPIQNHKSSHNHMNKPYHISSTVWLSASDEGCPNDFRGFSLWVKGQDRQSFYFLQGVGKGGRGNRGWELNHIDPIPPLYA